MGRFETEFLATDENLAPLVDLSGRWIDHVHDRRPFAGMTSSKDEKLRRVSRRLVCNDDAGGPPWLIHDNTFVYAFLEGPPAGGRDANIWLPRGTCVKY